MEAFLHQQSNHAIMEEEEEEEEEDDDELGSMSSFSDNDDDDDDEEGSSNSVGSSSSDFTASSSMEGPLFEMASLTMHLPFKRGLSKHFEGKSQSFASLSNAKSLEDLVKPERPLLLFRRSRHELKASRSCGSGLDRRRRRRVLSTGGCSRAITKKSSRWHEESQQLLGRQASRRSSLGITISGHGLN